MSYHDDDDDNEAIYLIISMNKFHSFFRYTLKLYMFVYVFSLIKGVSTQTLT